MKLKKNDQVKIVMGKDKGKTGKIEKVLPKENKIVVGGINIFKRHIKKSMGAKESGIKEITKPLPVTNVALVCPKCTMVTRVGYKIEDAKKKRICKKCEQEI